MPTALLRPHDPDPDQASAREAGFDSRARHLTAAHAPTPVAEAPPRLVAVPPLQAAAMEPQDEASGPDPDSVRALALLVFEVIEGLRGIAQLGSLITLNAAHDLSSVRAARQEQRTVLREPAPPALRPGAVRVDRPTPGIAEVASVVHVGTRARAVAMRMEWLHQRWRATEIAVL